MALGPEDEDDDPGGEHEAGDEEGVEDGDADVVVEGCVEDGEGEGEGRGEEAGWVAGLVCLRFWWDCGWKRRGGGELLEDARARGLPCGVDVAAGGRMTDLDRVGG